MKIGNWNIHLGPMIQADYDEKKGKMVWKQNPLSFALELMQKNGKVFWIGFIHGQPFLINPKDYPFKWVAFKK